MIARVRELTHATHPPSRIDTVADSLDWAMTAPQTGIYTANGADVMAPERIIQARLAFAHGERWGTYYQVEDWHSPVLGMMNVAYVLSAQPGYPGHRLAEIPSALPRFRLIARIRPARSLQEAAAMLRSPDFKPAEEAIVEGAPAAPAIDDNQGAVQVLEYGLRSLQLKVTAAGPRYLVTAETNYPGWRAWVDGRPEPIYYTNVAFRGLWVPAGNHTVRMRFEPAALPYTAAASGLGWLIWLVLWWLPAEKPAPFKSEFPVG
jgi:membrane protein YfhO